MKPTIREAFAPEIAALKVIGWIVLGLAVVIVLMALLLRPVVVGGGAVLSLLATVPWLTVLVVVGVVALVVIAFKLVTS